MRLLRESPTLISFTRSISHLSLAVLVPEVNITSASADNGGDKDLNISDDWIADNVAIQTRSSYGVWQPSFSNNFEKSASIPKPNTWSAAMNTSIKFWLAKYCELTRLCSLANVSRFGPEFWWQLVGGRVLRLRSISVQSRVLLPATCTTWFLSTCVDILVPNSDLVTDAVHCARLLYSSACAAHPTCCLGIGIMPIQAQSSHLFMELSDYHTCCKTPDYKYWMPT